jgi:hypothetical protein
MPTCPDCDYEYKKGAKTCPSCGADLTTKVGTPTKAVAKKDASSGKSTKGKKSTEADQNVAATTSGNAPVPDSSEDEDSEDLLEKPLVAVYESTDEALADAVLAALEDAGIPVVDEFDRAPLGGNGLDLGVLHGPYVRLMVPEARADEARRIVSDFMEAYGHGELELSDEEVEAADNTVSEFDEEEEG